MTGRVNGKSTDFFLFIGAMYFILTQKTEKNAFSPQNEKRFDFHSAVLCLLYHYQSSEQPTAIK